MNIALIGSGTYSFAIATLLLNNKENKLTMWSHDSDFTLDKSFQGKITLSYDIGKVIEENDIIFLLIASSFMKDTIDSLPKKIFENKTVLIGTKGLLRESPYFYSIYFRKYLSVKDLGYFAGPNFASDILEHKPISITFAISKRKMKNMIQKIFQSVAKLNFHGNIQSLEFASALKNVYAIGAGIIDSYYESQSTLFSYLSYSLEECLSIIDEVVPIEKLTIDFHSIPVDIVGDFFLTGTMKESRNRNYGTLLASGENTEIYLKENTVEGYETLFSLFQLLKKSNVHAPIFYTIYQIVMEGMNPKLLEEVVFKN